MISNSHPTSNNAVGVVVPDGDHSGDSNINIVSHAGAAFFCQQLNQLVEHRLSQAVNHNLNIFVAGCGAGHEAAAIQRQLSAEVEAIDIGDFVPKQLRESTPVNFSVGSVCDTPYEDGQFDAIFYHHVIEHVDDPAASLKELARVLKDDGWLFVGTPNRHRLLSSVGAHKQSEWDATLKNKIVENVRDWRDRLTGRFRNELGAHAGFSRRELDRMLAKHFEQRRWLTEDYLRYKYAAHRFSSLVKVATLQGLSWFTAPAIYVICQKKAVRPSLEEPTSEAAIV